MSEPVMTAADSEAAIAAMNARYRSVEFTLVSPQVSSDGVLTARLYAPDARDVRFRADWSEKMWAGVPMTRNDDGVWTYVSKPLRPALIGYGFLVDGVFVFDPKNWERDRTIGNAVGSLVEIPGPETQFLHIDPEVPHGAVSEVRYASKALGRLRRMHVYTPPGYEPSSERYPVLYLLHGGGQDDSSWSTGGRAGFILDNLIAAGEARPMIVVMPAGQVGDSSKAISFKPDEDAFTADFLGDVIPTVEARFRTLPGPQNRALAGLSMGGLQTLNIGLTHPETFGALGAFSTGWFRDDARRFAETFPEALTPRTNDRIPLIWVGVGTGDLAHLHSARFMKVMDERGVRYTYHETDGGHTWINWRRYLNTVSPLLFQ
jgi:enterochelin esterase-like enzyme